MPEIVINEIAHPKLIRAKLEIALDLFTKFSNSEFMELAFIAVTAFATVTYAWIYWLDYCRRHRQKSVGYIQVPNQNPGGYLEFATQDGVRGRSGVTIVKSITVKSDNTVEVAFKENTVSTYARFIAWQD